MSDKSTENEPISLRVALISDTHLIHDKMTQDLNKITGDIIIHAGDFLEKGNAQEITDFCSWYSKLNFKVRILISGNHDYGFDIHPDISQSIVKKFEGIIYLQDSGVNIDLSFFSKFSDKKFENHSKKSINIWGNPWTPDPGNTTWSFVIPEDSQTMQDKVDLIPEGTDIVVTHTPPFDRLDKNTWNKDAEKPLGSEKLLKRIEKIKPKISVFGHIHQSFGHLGWNYNTEKTEKNEKNEKNEKSLKFDTHFFNAAATYLLKDKKRHYVHKPFLFDWKPETNEIIFCE